MDVASIRIQFMTLTKTIQSNKSICHLEVIPNVTNVVNIDKIEGKSENNKTEYILPINYKIILKRVKPTDLEESHKVYYSCVDLLQKSVNSINNVELGSGDVSRIVSDNNFAQYFTTVQDEGNEKLDKKTKQNMTKECAQNLKLKFLEEKSGYSQKASTVMFELCKEKHIRERSFIYLRDDVFDKHCNIVLENNSDRKTTSVQIEISTEKIKNNKVKGIVSEHFSFEANIMKPVSVETLTDLNAKLENGFKIKKTSIISEQDNKLRPLLRTVYQNTTFCNTPKQIPEATKCNTLKENMKDIQHNTIYNTGNAMARKSFKDNILSPVISRIHTEYKMTSALRLSNFIQQMEKEILPLKITLNEIINKCISLGLSLNCKLLHEPESYGPQDFIIQKCYKQLQPTNRGVYYIVYNK